MAYRIKTVAEMTGIPKNTLVAWERRYGLVEPQRLANGYRVYSDADVATLKLVQRRLDEGYKISEAIALLDQPTAEAEDRGQSSRGLDALAEDVVQRLLSFDRAGAAEVLQRAYGLSYRDQLSEVFFPILEHVGHGWETGRATVAQEHFATAFVRDQMVAMLLHLECGPAHGPHVVVACLPDERHELGALGLAIRLALGGWRVTYLGADVPSQDLAGFVREHEPRMVCGSVIQPTTLDALHDWTRVVEEGAPEGTRLVVGGAGLGEVHPPTLGRFQLVRHVDDLNLT